MLLPRRAYLLQWRRKCIYNLRNAATDREHNQIEEMRKRRPSPPNFFKQLPNFTNPFSTLKSPPTMSYLIIGPQHRGKFDVAKAIELGVPKGPARGKLANGHSITVEVKFNGENIQRTIHPEDVVGKAGPRGVCAPPPFCQS